MKQGLPDLETEISTINWLDHEHIEWQRVRRTEYLIHQHLRYEYPGPISDLKQRLMILPPTRYGNQARLDYRLTVKATDYEMMCWNDDFGNEVIHLEIPRIEEAVDFEAWILIESSAEILPHYVPSHWLTDTRLLEPSPLTQPDAALRNVAEELLGRGLQGRTLAESINAWTYQALQYEHNRTSIHTTAAEALAQGHGVCQDYAHIMLTLCRLCGLPARYVSGHMLGEGGTHAWVEVLFPLEERPEEAEVVAFDPTHERKTSMKYLTIAVGRDYYDVAPTSGTYRAAFSGQLLTQKYVGLTSLEYTDTPEQASETS